MVATESRTSAYMVSSCMGLPRWSLHRLARLRLKAESMRGLAPPR